MRLLCLDPSRRITTQEILRHPWLTQPTPISRPLSLSLSSFSSPVQSPRLFLPHQVPCRARTSPSPRRSSTSTRTSSTTSSYSAGSATTSWRFSSARSVQPPPLLSPLPLPHVAQERDIAKIFFNLLLERQNRRVKDEPRPLTSKDIFGTPSQPAPAHVRSPPPPLLPPL